jgi:NitT/TauT family transport system substrate-binding protein
MIQPLALVLLAALLIVTGCGPLAATETPSPETGESALPAQPSSSAPPAPTGVTLGMGYIPSVQFAPLYVAVDRGYYAEEGLEVEFNYGFEADLMKLVGTDELQFVIGSGDQVILARAQGLPVVYVMQWYRRFPVAVFALAEKGLDSPKKLEGHRVGISMLSGASYVAWKALVYGAKIDESKVSLEPIGFTQAAAVSQGRVDAALDYIANGPVQLRTEGRTVDVIAVSDYIDLVSNGLITNEKTIAERPELVRRLVRATLRGLKDTLDDPNAAFAICKKFVPGIKGDAEEKNRQVLQESIALWRTERLGISSRTSWEASEKFMREMGLISKDVDVDKLFTNRFVE